MSHGSWQPALDQVSFDARDYRDSSNTQVADAIMAVAQYCWDFNEHMVGEFGTWNPMPLWVRQGWSPNNPVVALGVTEGLAGWALQARRDLLDLEKLVRKGNATPSALEELDFHKSSIEQQRDTILAARSHLEGRTHPEYEQRAWNAFWEAREFANEMIGTLNDIAYEVRRRFQNGRLTLPAYGIERIRRSRTGQVIALLAACFGAAAALVTIWVGAVEIADRVRPTKPQSQTIDPGIIKQLVESNRDLADQIRQLNARLESGEQTASRPVQNAVTSGTP